MNQFREMMEKGIKIKLIGDSITAGAGASGAPIISHREMFPQWMG